MEDVKETGKLSRPMGHDILVVRNALTKMEALQDRISTLDRMNGWTEKGKEIIVVINNNSVTLPYAEENVSLALSKMKSGLQKELDDLTNRLSGIIGVLKKK